MIYAIVHLYVHIQVAERNPYIVNLASQGERVHKRQLSYSNIRIHPVFINITAAANVSIQGDDSPLFKAINTLQNTLLVHPVQGNLIIPPRCPCELTTGTNRGKCCSDVLIDYKCGHFGVIPQSYIGTREVCSSSSPYAHCVTQGPDGPGLPNADYLLFVSASNSTSEYRIR